ncbi:MAG: hypothetical protein J3Q66DRAFT_350282 [Benniella sp.]|nr:MAG: hypothetical protein J3Q66DRAFT_350282 [Benniella sp.]
MYALFGHPTMPSRRQYPAYPTSPFMFSPYPPTTNAVSYGSFADDLDSPDEEEQLLIAALERKRQQKLARQQLLEQQRQQQLIEQELARRRRAQAIAQAKYEAEQEALRQQRRRQQQEQAALEHLFLQRLHQQQVEEQRRREAAKQVAAARALAEAKKLEQLKKEQEQQKKQQQVAAQAAAPSRKNEDEEMNDAKEESDPLSDLLTALFFPHAHLKRQQSQEQQYPSKRRHQEQEQEKAQKAKEQKELEAKQQQEKETAAKSAEAKVDSKDGDLISEYFQVHPDIKSIVEAVLGAKIETPKPKNAKVTDKPAPTTETSTPKVAIEIKEAPITASSTNSSPELLAADILKQRRDRLQEQQTEEKEEKKQVDPIQEKHSELNSIGTTLDDLSRELDMILIGTIENKKQILMTEENLTKTMLRLDSVLSEGDASIRKHRKELIKKSQALLDLVDEYKSRDASAAVKNSEAKSVAVEAEAEAESESKPESEHEPEHEIDTLSISDMESLPDTTENDNSNEDTVESSGPSSTEPTNDSTFTGPEPMEVEPELSNSISSEPSSDEEEPSQEPKTVEKEVSESKPEKAIDPLDLIVESALRLASNSSQPQDHDFEMVFAH